MDVFQASEGGKVLWDAAEWYVGTVENEEEKAAKPVESAALGCASYRGIPAHDPFCKLCVGAL